MTTRVLLLTQYFWPEQFIINEIAVALVASGIEMDVLTGMPNYPSGRFAAGFGGIFPKRDIYSGLYVLRVPHTARGSSKFSLGLNYISFPASASFFGRRGLSRQYDVIFVYAPSPATIGLAGLSLKAAFGARLVLWVQDLWPESVIEAGGVRSPTLLRLMERMMSRIYQGCDRILVPSRSWSGSVTARGAGLQSIKYVPNTAGQNFVPIDRSIHKEEELNLPRGFRIMFGGNIGEAQDVGTALSAAAMIRDRPDIQWIFIGDGRRREWAVERTMQLGLTSTVHFLGSRPSGQMPSYYAQADALLITLKAGSVLDLTVPSKLQAYLACGRPILGALNGDAARIVRESGAGLSSPSGDPAQLAAGAVQLAGLSKEALNDLGEAARRYFVANFAFDRVVSLLREAISEVCDMSDGGGRGTTPPG